MPYNQDNITEPYYEWERYCEEREKAKEGKTCLNCRDFRPHPYSSMGYCVECSEYVEESNAASDCEMFNE